jgi:hypothetical protein
MSIRNHHHHHLVAIAIYVAAAAFCLLVPSRAQNSEGDFFVNVYPFGQFAFVSVLLATLTWSLSSERWTALLGAVSWAVMLVTISLVFDMWGYRTLGWNTARLLQRVLIIVAAAILALHGVRMFRRADHVRTVSHIAIGSGMLLIAGTFVWLALRMSGLFAPAASGFDAVAIDAIRFNRAVLGSSVALAIGLAMHFVEARRRLPLRSV